MTYLLDTDICSYHLRTAAGLTSRFKQYSGRLYVPTIVAGELFVWAYRLENPSHRLELVREIFDEVEVLQFDEMCAERFGKERAALMNQGITVPRIDMMIAAIALVHGHTLVTHNIKDFVRVPGLQLEDWISG